MSPAPIVSGASRTSAAPTGTGYTSVMWAPSPDARPASVMLGYDPTLKTQVVEVDVPLANSAPVTGRVPASELSNAGRLADAFAGVDLLAFNEVAQADTPASGNWVAIATGRTPGAVPQVTSASVDSLPAVLRRQLVDLQRAALAITAEVHNAS